MNQPRHDASKSAEARTKEILEAANREIFNDRLSDITELTYAYEPTVGPDGAQRWFNTTIFTRFAGFTPGTPAEELVEGTRAQLAAKLDAARKLAGEIPAQDAGGQAQLLRKALANVSMMLECALVGLPYEAEKAGIPCAHDRARRMADAARLEEIETRAFGGTVRSKPEEAAEAAHLLGEKLAKGRGKLTDEEAAFMEGVRDKMAALGAGAPQPAVGSGRAPVAMPADELLAKPVAREKYVQILKLALEIYGIDLPVVVDSRSSVYDGTDALYIPSHESYATQELGEVLALVQHEVETHFLTNANNLAVFGPGRGEGNLVREEGLAMAFEGLGNGETLDSFDFRMSYEVLAGELLDGADYERFMALQFKAKGSTPDFKRLLRRKRNYPMDVPGVQHKDVTYDRGVKGVVNFVKEGGDPRDLFVGKVSFEDLDPALELAKENGAALKLPMFVTEVVRFALAGNKVTHDEFVKYLRAKYPFLGDRLDPALKLTRQNAAKVKKILRLLETK